MKDIRNTTCNELIQFILDKLESGLKLEHLKQHANIKVIGEDPDIDRVIKVEGRIFDWHFGVETYDDGYSALQLTIDVEVDNPTVADSNIGLRIYTVDSDLEGSIDDYFTIRSGLLYNVTKIEVLDS